MMKEERKGGREGGREGRKENKQKFVLMLFVSRHTFGIYSIE